ncbi:hypothetical protein C0Q70_11286 [Pomacea canaliculata]|uniref:SUEL-type lectin domain-containing protein n=1 Tax=Pomacea canaliculata TaxID=400727 RepID=A0A2T7P5I6_POMCA|nr:hypothetical protein C0Q70_11286 [Pomacea canaliculata]
MNAMTGQLNTWLNDGRVIAVGLFILWLCAPQSAPQDVVVTVESSKCYGKSDCSLHLMNCSARHRMAIKEAAYYFQTTARFTQCGGAVNAVPPYCMDDCCRNNGSDCSQSMTPDNLELVRSSCSYQTTCSTRAQWAGKVTCGSGFAVSSTYDVLRADCISDDVIVDPCTDVTVKGNLLSIIYGYNTVVNPNCTCRLDATSGNDTNNNQNIIISAYDINASYDSVWSMTITKAGMEHPPILYQLQGFQNYFPAAELLRQPSPSP